MSEFEATKSGHAKCYTKLGIDLRREKCVPKEFNNQIKMMAVAGEVDNQFKSQKILGNTGRGEFAQDFH